MTFYPSNSPLGGRIPPAVFCCSRCLQTYGDDRVARLEDGPTSRWLGRWVCPTCYDGPDPVAPDIGPDDIPGPRKGL